MSRLKPVLCGILFVIAFTGSLGASRQVLDRVEIDPGTLGLNLVERVGDELAALRASRATDPARLQVVFLGDSVSIRTRAGAKIAPVAIESNLKRRRAVPAFELRSLAALGAGPFDYYFLADEIAASRPDVAVIALTLQAFGDSSRRLSRDRLSGWIAPSRALPAILGPNHWIGLTADDLLMNLTIVQSGAVAVWRGILSDQTRVVALRTAAQRGVGAAIGNSGPQAFEMVRFAHAQTRGRVPGRDRYDFEAEHRHYGRLLRGLERAHPVLTVLGNTIALLEEAGVDVLVYTNPINLTHLRSVGLPEDDGLEHSLATLEAVVTAAGGHFLDLHDLILEDAAFHDAAGHLGTPAVGDPMERVARKLGPVLASILDARDHADPVRTGSR